MTAISCAFFLNARNGWSHGTIKINKEDKYINIESEQKWGNKPLIDHKIDLDDLRDFQKENLNLELTIKRNEGTEEIHLHPIEN
ncbi:hypothetical protein ABEB36_002216 [Hypothenemus hampei]|uniref:Uncharacterized protein n=1 Tax=Hypothenemus hampei TaxID=57062 RepID=A0ABD1F513_HYPHA